MIDLDLSLVGTDDLIAEIKSRALAALVVWTQPKKIGDDQSICYSYSGGLPAALGLAAFMRTQLTNMATDSENDDDDAGE